MTREHEAIEAGGLGEGNAFTIAASAKAFEVLSSNLYKNKPLAVIREITCNAADAHKLTGAKLSDIRVQIPSWSNPQFVVRDFGPGLSHPDVLSLYTTYFRSTKDQSNDAIGGFGLGSKSPFAVSDQFTVKSWHGGRVRTYVMYKQDGLPRVNTISDESTSSNLTGLEVSVAVKSQDVGEFQSQARQFFSWWPELPTFTGNQFEVGTLAFDPEEVYIKSSKEINGIPEWAILKNGAHPTVFMGLVPYALDAGNVTGLSDAEAKLLAAPGLFLNMPIGSLSISPSREALSYDAATMATLRTKAGEIAKEAVTTAQAEVENQPTLYDARKFAYRFTSPYDRGQNIITQLIESMAKNGKLLWQGKNLYKNVVLTFDKHPETTGIIPSIYRKKPHWRNFQRDSASFTEVASILPGSSDHAYTVWLPAPPTAKTYRTLLHNFYDPAKSQESYSIFLLWGVPFDGVAKLFIEHGFRSIVNYEKLEEAPKQTASPKKATQTTGYLFDLDRAPGYLRSFHQPSNNSGRVIKPLDLTGGGLVIPFFEGSPYRSNTLEMYRLCLDGKAFLTSRPANVIGIAWSRLNMKSVRKALADAGWEVLDNDYLNRVVNKQTVLASAILQGHSSWTSNVRSSVSWAIAKDLQKVRTSHSFHANVLAWLDVVTKVIPLYETKGYCSFYDSQLQSLGADFVKEYTQAQDAHCATLTQTWARLMQSHPLLRHISWTNESLPAIIDYLSDK
jgi:hypothetical protein